MASPRRSPPPPLEGNDRLITSVITAGWAIALIVVLIFRGSLPAAERWWIWTCGTGVAMGIFGLWYVPRLKRSRAQAAVRRAARLASQGGQEGAAPQEGMVPRDGTVPLDVTVPPESAASPRVAAPGGTEPAEPAQRPRASGPGERPV